MYAQESWQLPVSPSARPAAHRSGSVSGSPGPENREFFERLGYRQIGLASHAGSPVPTFACFAKQVG